MTAIPESAYWRGSTRCWGIIETINSAAYINNQAGLFGVAKPDGDTAAGFLQAGDNALNAYALISSGIEELLDFIGHKPMGRAAFAGASLGAFE